MTPGLAFFYGGLVRRKNILSVFMQCFTVVCVIGLQWVLFGYSLAFGPDHGGVIGGLSYAGLQGVGLEPNATYAATIPHMLFMVYQLMFAVITPALIIGAFAERMKFSAFLVFAVLWSTIVYDPLAHWMWGEGGFLREYGALDFAGGTVVHISAGMAALAAALVVGRRHGYPDTGTPHNLAFVVLGASSCGSAGSASTEVVRSVPARSPRSPSSLRNWARCRVHWPGSSWTGSWPRGRPLLGFFRADRGSGGCDSRRGVRGSPGRSGDRRRRRCAVLRERHGGEGQVQVRRLPRRLRYPRGRGDLGRAWRWGSGRQ